MLEGGVAGLVESPLYKFRKKREWHRARESSTTFICSDVAQRALVTPTVDLGKPVSRVCPRKQLSSVTSVLLGVMFRSPILRSVSCWPTEAFAFRFSSNK